MNWRQLALLVGWLLLAAMPGRAAEYRPLPPPPPVGLSADWLIYKPGQNRLTLYLAGYHQPSRAYYQWVSLQPGQPTVISFTALQNLSLFLDNQLVFTAPEAGSYTLDLARFVPATGLTAKHLLCVWHPTTPPAYASFVDVEPVPVARSKHAVAPLLPQERVLGYHNAYVCFLLLLGLLYGGVRVTYRPGFSRIYELRSFLNNSADQDFLIKPTATWLNLLLLVVFSLSFALLLVAVHTSLQNVLILRQLFNVPESAIVLRVLLYTGLVLAFVLLKYPYISFMGYIFDVLPLVTVQYREFVRTILLIGLALPFVVIIYLTLNTAAPAVVLWLSNGVITFLLVATVVRIALTLHRKSSVLNLHLFSYLCATEVIPLVILLKLIVF
ncbi:DUF4271 domain-containing protein [Hymenobacter sp. J193]|uniref:DUF4271 domain-containing protein n=1 Tax=Hymenobacter sp. J193 TaxID=2898429 RepID=UPI002151982F|nr:DUF4271 domain-containing protein [Hymenobacter sp. J193]MCR5887815.1 DUF4271 domain-containing protein [Hymenobacter sp. J193]